MASHQGNYPTPRSLDKQGRGERRDEGMVCGSHSSPRSSFPVAPCCPPWRVRARPAVYRPPGFPSQGRRQFTGGIYSAPFSSAHLIRLGSSSHPPHGSPFLSGQANSRRQGKAVGQAGERLSLSAPSRIALTLVSSLVSAGGARDVSFPSADSVGGPVSPSP